MARGVKPLMSSRLRGELYERAALQLTRPYNTPLWVAGPLCGAMPQAGFDPLSAEVQTSTECEFDAITIQATTAGLKSGYYYLFKF